MQHWITQLKAEFGDWVSNIPGNPGNTLEICKVSWKLSDSVRLFKQVSKSTVVYLAPELRKRYVCQVTSRKQLTVNKGQYRLGISNIPGKCQPEQQWSGYLLSGKHSKFYRTVVNLSHGDSWKSAGNHIYLLICKTSCLILPYLPSVIWYGWLGHLIRKTPSPIWPIMCSVGR